MFFVIRSDSLNEVFDNKKDFLEVIRSVENPIVRTFMSKELALEFLGDSRSVEEIRKCIKLDKAEKKERRSSHKREELIRLNERRFSPKSENIAFIDIEAGRNKAISIGLVVFDTKREIELYRFYSLLKPFEFVSVDSYCEKLTGISTEEVQNAKDYNIVYDEVESILERFKVSQVLSWGTMDKVFVRNSLPKDHSYEFVGKIFNIQTYISSITSKVSPNKCWSLQNMKRILKIDETEVKHNALSDSLDLLKVYKNWTKMTADDIDNSFVISFQENLNQKRVG